METTYVIEISYRTGDSFSSSDELATLELTWKNLSIAKKNLTAIREHDNMCSELTYASPRKRKEIYAKYKKQFWFSEDDDGPEYNITLLADNGNPWKIYPFWCGYFETLYGASIEIDKEKTGLSFKTNNY